MALYAFDGTWNVRDEKDAIRTVQPSQYGADASFRRDTEETNVHRFREFYGADDCEYLEGVGTRGGWIGRVAGGLSGFGGKWRIRKMYEALCKRYHSGDTVIDIVGFSRGAALAVHFANVIERHGIPHPSDSRRWSWRPDPLFGWWPRRPPLGERVGRNAPAIRFLGLWDTVASFGIPIGRLRNRARATWIVRTLPANVRHSFHAMALDEVRKTFELIHPQPPENSNTHYELWFRGVHSNIGGSYPDRGLSDIALAWMMEMFMYTLDKETDAGNPILAPKNLKEALRRLEPEPAAAADAWIDTTLEALEPNPDGELGHPKENKGLVWRPVPADALVHHSAFRRTANLLIDQQYNSNRRLLRRIPGDARPVYDPPFFYAKTRRQEARAIAEEAFGTIPVRAAPWLSVNDLAVVRGDDWIGLGDRRNDLTDARKRDTFVTIAEMWLMSNCCAVDGLKLDVSYKDYAGVDHSGQATARWVIEVLLALEPYVPSLRAWRGASLPPPPAPST